MTMSPLVLFALFLVLAGIVLIGFGAKTLTLGWIGSAGGALLGFVRSTFAVAVALLGVLTLCTGLRMFVPAAWGGAGMALVLGGCVLLSAAGTVSWTKARHRRRTAAAGTAPASMAASVPAVPTVPAVPCVPNGRRHAWPHPGLAAGLAAVRAVRQARADKLKRVFWYLVVPGLCLVGVVYGFLAVAMAAVVCVSVLQIFHIPVDGISEIEYRRLPGSTDHTGKHTCVYCGRSGVYRRGAYASNSTWHECTGCRKHLYVD